MKWLNINPIVLILINILAPSMYIFVNGSYLQVFLAIFCSVLLCLMGQFKKLAYFAILYAVMYGIYLLGFSVEFFRFMSGFFAVLLQFVPCLMLASIVVSKYSSTLLLSALEGIHLPQVLVVATTVTLKYFPTFRREFRYILESMRLRGIAFTWKKPIESFRYFVVPQLFRCAALAEEVTAAGLVKGIDAPVRRTSYFELKFRFTDSLVLCIFAAGIIGGYIWAA